MLQKYSLNNYSRFWIDSQDTNAIDELLGIEHEKTKGKDLVALAGFNNGLFQSLYKPTSTFSVSNWIEQNEVYWKPKLIDNKNLYLEYIHKMKKIDLSPTNYKKLVTNIINK